MLETGGKEGAAGPTALFSCSGTSSSLLYCGVPAAKKQTNLEAMHLHRDTP